MTAQDGDNALVISENKDITLDLNGHVIDRNLSKKKTDGAAIKVLGKLTIKDSSKDHKGAIKNANSVNSGGGIVVRGTGASLTLEYVTISNCSLRGTAAASTSRRENSRCRALPLRNAPARTAAASM